MMYLLKKDNKFVTQLLIIVRRKEGKNDYWKTLFLFLKNFFFLVQFIIIPFSSKLPVKAFVQRCSVKNIFLEISQSS